MAIRKIHEVGDPCLTKVCRPVTEFNDRLHELLDDMADTLEEAGGVGLAAPQVGELIQLVIIDTEYTGEADYDPFVLINPRIVEQSDSTFTFNEGCLSIPGINVEIERADHVAVEAYDLNGDLMRYEADGDLLCVCLQHEIDHLHGITMFERLSPMKRIAAMRDYQQARARGAKPGDTE